MGNSRRRGGFGRIVRAFVALAIMCGVLSVAGPASAATRTSVDFTVRESLPIGTPGTLIASDVPGCSNATVATVDVTSVETRRLTIFRGTKVLDCGGGDTFSLRFVAVVRGCSSSNFGVWARRRRYRVVRRCTWRRSVAGELPTRWWCRHRLRQRRCRRSLHGQTAPQLIGRVP